MLKITILLILGLCSANLVYSDERTNDTDNYIVDDLSIVLLESTLIQKTQALHTYLANLKSGQFYEDTSKAQDQISDTNDAFYGLIHSIGHIIHKGLDAIKGVVKSVTKVVENAVHGLANSVKTVIHDATHIRELIVNQIKGLENEVKGAVMAIKKIPVMVIGGLKNALADVKNIARDTLTLHISRLKDDLVAVGKQLGGVLTTVLKAELEAAKKMLEGDLKAALEAWAIAELGPFGAALGELLQAKAVIENYKNALLDKLNLAKQLGNKITNVLKVEIDQHLTIIRNQYNAFANALHGKIDLALKNANLALGGVPAQIIGKVENAIDMVGQGLTQAKNRVLDLQHQLQVAVGDLKTKVQAELNAFMQQHGAVLLQTRQQLLALKAQVEAKLKTVQGALQADLVQLQGRIDARLDELNKFAQQIGAKIDVVVQKVETVFEEMARKNTDLHNTIDNLKNTPLGGANTVIAKLNDVRDTATRMLITVNQQLGGSKQVLDITFKSPVQILRTKLTSDLTNYLNSNGQVSSLMHSRLADLQAQFNKVITNGGTLKQIISLEIQKQLELATVTLKATLNQEAAYINAKLKDIEVQIISVPADIKLQLTNVKNRLLAQLKGIVEDPLIKVVQVVVQDYNTLKAAFENTKKTLLNPLAQAKALGARITAPLAASVVAALQNVQNQFNAMINEIQAQFGAAVKNAIPALGGTPQVIQSSVNSVLDYSNKAFNEANVRANELQLQLKGVANGAIKATLVAQIGGFQKQRVAIMRQNAQQLAVLNQQVALRLRTAVPAAKPVFQNAFNQINALVAAMNKIR